MKERKCKADVENVKILTPEFSFILQWLYKKPGVLFHIFEILIFFVNATLSMFANVIL